MRGRTLALCLAIAVASATSAATLPIAQAASPIAVVAVASAPDGEGYVVAESDGVVWAYGSVAHRGDLRAIALNQPIVGMAVTP